MAKKRLTMQYRENVLAMIDSALIEPRLAAWRKKEGELADEARLEWLGQDTIDQLDALPAGLVSTADSISVHLGETTGRRSDVTHLDFRDPDTGRDVKRPCYGRWDRSYQPKAALKKKIIKHIKEKEKIDSAREEIRTKFWPLLLSVKTREALIEAWPEVAAYLPVDPAAPMLPMITMGEINTTLAELQEAAEKVI